MTETQTEPNVVWEPLPPFQGRPSSQALALACPADEILFHGTRGSSKTETQIAYFVSRCGMGYGARWRGLLLDRGYKNLEDIIAKTQEMIPKIFPEAKFLSSDSKLYWEFPEGERLYFRHLSVPKDYLSFHGQQFSFIGFNELTSYPTPQLYDLIKSCNRSGFLPEKHSPKLTKEDKAIILNDQNWRETHPEIQERILPNIPLVMFATTNPMGPGHSWIKRRWIDKAAPGVPFVTKSNVFNPRTGEVELVKTTSVHIFGCYKENIYLDVKYVADLDAITDPNRRKAWLAGDWSITSGGALDDIWDDKVHVIDPFPIPDHWKVNRSMDWGSSKPFSIGWWAECNGEEVILPSGESWCPPRGTRINFAEWYGGESFDDNVGLLMGADEAARRIIDIERGLVKKGIISKLPDPGPADSQIYAVADKAQKTTAKIMEDEGIFWIPCKKGRDSRKIGLEVFRSYMRNSLTWEGPAVYFMRSCPASLALLPALPRCEKDPDDVATDSNDHVWDQVRYAIMQNPITITSRLTR